MKVELIGHYGDDDLICDVARVSYNKRANQYTKAQNEKLIKYLIDHGHSSPMRHTLLQFRVSCGIYVERQIFKHTVGISTNSVSGRYVDFSDEYEMIPLGAWRMQSKSSKQGSGGPVEHRYQILADRIQSDVIEFAKKSYQQLLDMEISKEQARTILPLNLTTSFVWTGTLQAFLHLVNLRTKPDAQKETRDVVQEMFRQVREKKLFEATINNWPLDYAK